MPTLLRLAVIAVLPCTAIQMPAREQPETVMITFHAKAGADSALRSVIDRHWSTLERLKLTSGPLHATLRGTETGGVYFVEIFTWRDSAIPDNAPEEVRASWGRMTELTEARGGKPGIDIAEVADVTAGGRRRVTESRLAHPRTAHGIDDAVRHLDVARAAAMRER
jgi:hypothetical protein